MEEILKAIPHRPPFLFVDEIVSSTENSLKTRRLVKPEEDFFKGHYPDNPIMPGVLVCEAVFQTGAIMLCRSLAGSELGKRFPVLTRIQDVKFKNMVRPGDELEIEVTLVEKMANVFFMRGSVKTADRKVLTVDFACALAEGTN